MNILKINGSLFVDGDGRQVILHGINLVNKNPDEGYFFDAGPELFVKMRQWGFNVIRLGVIWDGLEPEPGVYDEDYLKRLDLRIQWAKENDLYVFLDMHQDLYSAQFSDGAPVWATLTEGAPHVNVSEVWSDAYFTSPAVQNALDNFWSNTPASDGVGLQDHYARAWALLAARYKDEAHVIGFDMMNEPFPGSSAVHAQEMMFAKGAELLAALGVSFGDTHITDRTSTDDNTVAALMMQWLTEEGRAEILEVLRDMDLYAQVVDATQEVYQEFERTRLMAMYERVASAIRATGATKTLYLETTMGSNMGVYSAVQPTIVNGKRDAAQVYAPHGYDLVVDTPNVAYASPERVRFIFQRHGETAQRLGMPMLVGEWGAYGRHDNTLDAARYVVSQFEELLCGETYWAYEPHIDQVPCFPAIHRPYPERVAGTLLQYHYDAKRCTFSCTWQEDGSVNAPTRIYLPDWFTYDDAALAATPSSDTHLVDLGGRNRILEIAPDGDVCTRTLTIDQTGPNVTELSKDLIYQAAHVMPSPRQLAWQQLELTAFFHFTVNTFTDREWGLGTEDPQVFNPTELDTRQWIRTVAEARFKLAILTTKHHDGFCLWPSAWTEHSVKHSRYKDGQGDVVREFVEACREYDIKVGFYLSPWDRHEATYGTDAYNEYFTNQLTELLTNYGPVSEVWFDGACGEGPNGKTQVYDWERYYRLIRGLQPDAAIAIAGPDVRWVGNEDGLARENEWSVLPAGALNQDKVAEDSQHAELVRPEVSDARGEDRGSRKAIAGAARLVWYPAECDVSIRPGWFYHASEDDQVKSPDMLVDLYFKSVGRNAGLLLNLPPDRRGLIHENDVASLRGMRALLDDMFGDNLIDGASVTASHSAPGHGAAHMLDGDDKTYWTSPDWQETATLTFELAGVQTFNVVELQEQISVGQRIEAFTVEAKIDGDWQIIAEGGTVGKRRLLRCDTITTDAVRVQIQEARFAPTLQHFSLYLKRR